MQINFPYTKELLILNEIFNINEEDNIRIVGGAVRNFLMEKEISDYDLSCKFVPEKNMEILEKNKIKYVPTGVKFGTITAIINGKPFEITSTRKDIKTDGRHAEVEYTDNFEIDAGRRDFTFNALYLDFKGNVFDYFNGISDLKKGIVRFIGNPEKRIQEDYLRILRFFRFFCYYGSVLDNEGLKYAIKHKDKLKNLSGERIKAEMFKILKANYPILALNIMKLNNILFSATEIENFNFEHLEILYSIKKYINAEISIELILSLFLKDIKELNILKNRWKLSNKENEITFKLLEHKNDEFYDENNIKKLIFYENKKNFIIDLIIINSILNKQLNTNLVNEINKKIEFVRQTAIPIFPLNSQDLKEAGFADVRKYSTLLKIGKEIFVKSNYSFSKDEIISELKK